MRNRSNYGVVGNAITANLSVGGIYSAVDQQLLKDSGSWTTVPGAPTIGSAVVASATSVSVTFTDSASTGGSPITGYKVKSSPGNITATGSSSPIVVTGLTQGQSYTFTVQAINSLGPGSPSGASNSATPTDIVSSISYLIVAGGGGGGSGAQGSSEGTGGGAGGLLSGAVSVTSSTPYTITIGGGGASWGAGTASSGFGISTTGGGYGVNGSTAGGNGGSGGGSYAASPGTGVAGPPRQGYDGGNGQGYGGTPGGGGGAGGAGNPGGTLSGKGGVGAEWPTGSGTYYAGGGGGVSGAGGTGGGGAGGSGGTATAGTVNTGGGGGGGWNSGNRPGGAGGSGVVIVRYPDIYAAAASYTGSPTITVADGYRTYKFTQSGSITF